MSEDEENFGSGEYADEEVESSKVKEEDWEDEFETDAPDDDSK